MQEGSAFPRPETPPSVDLRSPVDIAGWLREGWGIFKQEPLPFALITAIYGMLLLISNWLPFGFGGLLVSGPLYVGFYLVVADMALGRPFNAVRIFDGFRYFLPAFAAFLAISFFTVIGLILLIIPGLIVMAWYLFTYLFIADRGMGFWEAMEASRAIVRKDTIGFVFFVLSLAMVNVAGFLCIGVGLLASIPVTFLAIFAAYRRLAGLRDFNNPPQAPFVKI